MKNYFLLFSFLFVATLFTSSCKDDDDNPCEDITATYDGAVKGIIDATCAHVGCHAGAYDTYATMQSVLTAEKFGTRVLDEKNMPPAAELIPEGLPTELTDAQLEILQCWADAGYPEN